jgi:hypothetical protein
MGDPNYERSKLRKMAVLMAKDSDFAAFRTFTELHFVNILDIQHRLADAEKTFCHALKHRLEVERIIIEIRQLLKDYRW